MPTQAVRPAVDVPSVGAPDELLEQRVRAAVAAGTPPADVFRALVHAVGLARGLDLASAPPRGDGRPEVAPDPSFGGTIEAETTLGRLYELYGAPGRKASGRYYTPPALVSAVLDATLQPALAEVDQRGELDHIRILDPSCGAGAFLIAAAYRLVAWRLRGATAPDARRAAWTTVVTTNLYGVDVDPGAVELCRGLLWLVSGGATAAHIRCGDALLGASPEALAAGIPANALTARSPEERPIVARWRQFERSAVASAPARPWPSAAADAWCATFLWPRSPEAPPPPTSASLHSGAGPDDPTTRQVETLRAERRFFHWAWAFPEVHAAGGFDVVLGNPPFLNQLQTSSVQDRGAATLIDAVMPDTVSAYTDTASLLLARGWTLLRAGGWLGMVQPRAVLATQDAARIRRRLAAEGSLRHLWIADGHAFPGIDVHVCAITAQRSSTGRDVGHPPATTTTVSCRRASLARTFGLPAAPLPPLDIDMDRLADEDSWGALAAASNGVPALHLAALGRLGDIAPTTADFRDEYYGILPFLLDVREADERRFPRLLTVGLVDPARSLWGERSTRCGRRIWQHPRVDRDAAQADARVARWIERRQQPKILLATQTRVLEAVVDVEGAWLAITPMLVVTPPPDRLWHVAAVLLSPVASVWAYARYAGAALHPDAIKLSAGQVARIPLPQPGAAWDAAATTIAAAHAAADPTLDLYAAGRLMLVAYGGVEEEVLRWWAARLPRR